MTTHDYRDRLRTTVGASAAPYGYTLATWTTGAALIKAHGVPNVVETFAFMVGAVLGFALVVVVAFGGFTRHFDTSHNDTPVIWGSFHFFSVGVSIVVATLVAHLVDNVYPWPGVIAWLLGGCLYTTIYLFLAGAESYLAYRWKHRNDA